MSKCIDCNLNTILVFPAEHTEIIDESKDFFGVSIIGLGSGISRPTFDFRKSNISSITLGGDSSHIENIHFVINDDRTTPCVNVCGTNVTLKNVVFRRNSDYKGVLEEED